LSQIREKLELLLHKDEWSLEEQFWLLNVLESDQKDVLQDLLNEQFLSRLNESIPSENPRAREILAQIHQKIGDHGAVRQRPVRILIRQLAVAASLLVLFAAGYLVYENRTKTQDITATPTISTPNLEQLLPGVDKAILTLSDGSTVMLDEVSQGNIARQSSVDIRKLDKGELVYQGGQGTNELLYNTISTPRGGKFQITLSDGTKVWLNAASSLRFPVQFVGTERRVELTGEGYFEVAGNKEQPFVVDVSGKQEVIVLGTHFNINSYADELSVNTTLLKGSVNVRSSGAIDGQMLVPGQQLQLFKEGKVRLRSQVDTEETIAWKNDKFDFGESMELKAVMRQIERWYNVDVEYEGNVSGIELGGSISRNVNAKKVFEMLELTGAANFRMHEGKVIVSSRKN
jgi:ferric-dicitrate binding protein FerR (iron transport regulator)